MYPPQNFLMDFHPNGKGEALAMLEKVAQQEEAVIIVNVAKAKSPAFHGIASLSGSLLARAMLLGQYWMDYKSGVATLHVKAPTMDYLVQLKLSYRGGMFGEIITIKF